MNSPTSNLLCSIQALKNKLRSDHHELQGIRKDFALPISTIPEEKDHREFKLPKTCGKDCRQKLIDLRKKQQAEVQALVQAHTKQKTDIMQDYEGRLKQIENYLGQKVKEQEEYITALEEQIANSTITMQTNSNLRIISSSRQRLQLQKQQQQEEEKEEEEEEEQKQEQYQEQKQEQTQNIWHRKEQVISRGSSSQCIQEKTDKYEHIVNSLLQENAILMETVERLKMENRRLMVEQEESVRSRVLSVKPDHREYCSVQNQAKDTKHNPIFAKRNRLKFSKISQPRSSQNDQNWDSSNYLSVPSSWDEDSIMSQDMKMRTIKHLLTNVSNRPAHCR